MSLRSNFQVRDVVSFGIRIGLWPCVRSPFIQVNVWKLYLSVWYGSKMKEPIRLYLCFCAEFYTGERRGEWHETQPPYERPESSAYERPANCHQLDGCGYYKVIAEDDTQ